MSHAHSSESPQLRGRPSPAPTALKLHRLGWNEGEASVEPNPATGLLEEPVRSITISLGTNIRELEDPNREPQCH